jgi:hypothetical protein
LWEDYQVDVPIVDWQEQRFIELARESPRFSSRDESAVPLFGERAGRGTTPLALTPL